MSYLQTGLQIRPVMHLISLMHSPAVLLTQMSVFALNITPYITSSIIMQLLTIAIPKLEEMQKDGEDGRKKITAITRYVTVGLGIDRSLLQWQLDFGRQGILDRIQLCQCVIVVADADSRFRIPDVDR